MKLGRFPVQFSLAAALVAAVALAFIEMRNRDIDAEGLEAFRQENLFWNGAQLNLETLRLMDALHGHMLVRTGASAAVALERFDMLWSRTAIFETGETGRRLRGVTGGDVAERVKDVLAAHETLFEDVAAAPDAKIRDFIATLRALGPDLQHYIARLSEFEEARTEQVQSAVIESNRLGTAKVAVALATVAGLVVSLFLNQRSTRQRLDEQRRLTAEAQQAAEAKKRFLTMMSHELRTPMNGVIGMLALLERSPLVDSQRRLVGVAQRSAVEMLGLVEDILDLSDLQANLAPPEPEVIQLDRLGEDIGKAFARRLCRSEHGLKIGVVGDPARTVWVESELLVKAARQVLVFFVDRLAITDISVRLEHMDGEVIVVIAGPHDGPLRWSVDSFLGPMTDASATIQTDAIGPAVARGFLSQMQGAGALTAEDGVVTARLRAPAPLLDGFELDALADSAPPQAVRASA